MGSQPAVKARSLASSLTLAGMAQVPTDRPTDRPAPFQAIQLGSLSSLNLLRTCLHHAGGPSRASQPHHMVCLPMNCTTNVQHIGDPGSQSTELSTLGPAVVTKQHTDREDPASEASWQRPGQIMGCDVRSWLAKINFF